MLSVNFALPFCTSGTDSTSAHYFVVVDHNSFPRTITMQAQQHQTKTSIMATAANAPGLLQQVGMAGGAAVITVSFIHPIDVIKVSVHVF